MSPSTRAPAKVMLFGEYGVLVGGDALAVPQRTHHAWCVDADHDDPRALPAAVLEDLARHCESVELLRGALDLPALRARLAEGANVASDVPPGYGLGSSGAIVAAVYRAVRRREEHDPATLRELLGRMEDHFHGRSSGIDPLVCHLNKAIHASTGGVRVVADARTIPFELVDTGAPRSTASLARTFASRMQNPFYAEEIHDRYRPLSARCIAAWLRGDLTALRRDLVELSASQLRLLDFAIPEHVRAEWRACLDQREAVMKLCGAGGGGYLLRFEL